MEIAATHLGAALRVTPDPNVKAGPPKVVVSHTPTTPHFLTAQSIFHRSFVIRGPIGHLVRSRELESAI